MFLKLILQVLARLPLKLLYVLASCLYYLAYYILRYRRQVVDANLKLAFPHKTDREREQIGKSYYRRLADMVVENLKLSCISDEKISNMAEASGDWPDIPKNGRGIFLTEHFFNWELALLFLQRYVPIAFVYKKQPNKAVDDWMLNMRQRFGSKPVEMTETGSFIRAMRKKEVEGYLGILADQSPAGYEAKYWVKFFNRPTAFLKGIAKLSSVSNCPVYFVKTAYLKRGKYKLFIEPICGAGELSGEEILNRYAQCLEKAIREDPANWLWSHKRWKHTKPENVQVIGE